MAKLRVPSLQHLARNWVETPQRVQRRLVSLARNSPSFTYAPLFPAARDLLLFRQPYEEVAEGIRRAIKRLEVRENFLGILPMIRDHFEDIRPDFVQASARRFYPVGRGLMIPFDPPMIYGVGGKLHFPWFSFWRHNPLAAKRLSLFVTLVDEMLAQDPDLEAAQFWVLDFSAPAAGAARELFVSDTSEIPRLSDTEKREMLDVFAEGFRLAEAELAGAGPPPPPPGRDADPDQPDMFPPPNPPGR